LQADSGKMQVTAPALGFQTAGLCPSSSSSAWNWGKAGDQVHDRLVNWARQAWQVGFAEDVASFVVMRAAVAYSAEIAIGQLKHPFAPRDPGGAQFSTFGAGTLGFAPALPLRRWLRADASAALRELPFKHAEDSRANTSIAWEALERKVSRWSLLPDDWDGEGGVRPTREVVDAATAFIKRAHAAFLPVPQGYIAGDGEIGFVGGMATPSRLPHFCRTATSWPFARQEPVPLFALMNPMVRELISAGSSMPSPSLPDLLDGLVGASRR